MSSFGLKGEKTSRNGLLIAVEHYIYGTIIFFFLNAIFSKYQFWQFGQKYLWFEMELGAETFRILSIFKWLNNELEL